MSDPHAILIPYSAIALVTALVSASILSDAWYWKDRRNAARLLILAPVWPVPAIYGAFIGIRKLWRAADWRNSN